MNNFSKAERVAVKYLLEWGQYGYVDFPDLVVTSFFNLVSGNKQEKKDAVKILCDYMNGVLEKDKMLQVKKELLSCINYQ